MTQSRNDAVATNAQDAHDIMLKQLKGGETKMMNANATTSMEAYVELTCPQFMYQLL